MNTISLTKKIFNSVAAAILLIAAGSAQVSAQETHPAQAVIETAVNEMLEFLSANINEVKANPSLLADKVDESIVPHIDFVAMTRLSVGKNWRTADEQQKKDLVTEFQILLLNAYNAAMQQYGGEEATFEPFRPESREDRAVVRSVFMQESSSDVPVSYKLREKGGWFIYDIEVAGLSLVNNFRQKFTDEINSNGIDGLLEFLRKRNES